MPHYLRDAMRVVILFVRLVIVYILLRLALWLTPDDL